ncbi:MAG: sporadically distributed protein, TIGR04141 family [Cereibacter sphaeroides]|uniref:Sporadically distributed protein, TIGR04141 family n=1 Tax=Cereibacter sphaeroides TaxID=1063 RepID=A0A2W5S5F7_CERSP|nr:MAG: sporadically distributed protein, TIGR04141 family [Cereibacter sphaeroides]
MTKSRSFSIYLLKPGFDAETALEEDHLLEPDVAADNLPEGASIFILDSQPRPPWWRAYFGIETNLSQVNKGALIFLPVEDRCFALSFGHVAHNLRDSSYEYDFGLRVTLNSLDPQKLKSTDTVEPGAAKRQRTQLPIESELTFFDFDRDSTVLRSLTGKVKNEHRDLFRHATGSSNLRISTDVLADGLQGLCAALLALYRSEDYKTSFPEIQNIVPVRDPLEIAALNGNLLLAFRARDPDLNLTVPEIINYNDNVYVMFSGARQSDIYDDVFIGRYYDYLDLQEVDLADMDIDALKRHKLVLTDEAGASRDHHSIYKSLVFDTTLPGAAAQTFHLCDGEWYRIDNDYIARLQAYLDPLCVPNDLLGYNHATEGDYNQAVAVADPSIACLDMKDISPPGQRQVEPCDLLAIRGETAVFYHIKVSTLSAQLSHLFNQGVNAIELMRLEPASIDLLEVLVRDTVAPATADPVVQHIRDRRYAIAFGIVTRKDSARRSLNLPLFSRISLMRSMKSLRLMDVPGSVMFIADESVAAAGRKKVRKRKVPVVVNDDVIEAAE